MRRLLLIVLLLFATAPQMAPQGAAQTAGDVERVWRAWMASNTRTSGALVLLHAGQPAHEAEFGSVRRGQSLPLASLSKAVTAVCIADLVERGRLSFDSPLSRVLARTFARVGPPSDPRLLQATVGQLLVHRGGFAGGADDPTTTTALRVHLLSATARETAFDAQLKWTVRQKLARGPGGKYEYSNASYLLLGAVIEEATGRPYEDYCKESVLVPLGARDARLFPAWRIMASYGGWSMPLAQYGRFYQAFAGGNPAIGPTARAWMMSRNGKDVRGGAYYGLGTNIRTFPDRSPNYWHWGRWTYRLAGAFDGTLSATYATFAVRWGGADVNAVAYMEPALPPGAPMSDFDRTLGDAVAAVKRWP